MPSAGSTHKYIQNPSNMRICDVTVYAEGVKDYTLL